MATPAKPSYGKGKDMTEPIAKADKVAVTVPKNPTTVTEKIEISTDAFKVDGDTFVSAAEAAFREKVAKDYGKSAKLSDIELTRVDHHVGTAAFYTFTGKLTS